MFGKKIHLFTLFGFSVSLDLTWLFLFVLIVWSLAGGVFPARFKNLSTTMYVLMGAGGALGVFLSIVWHELCHSLVAKHYGLPMRGITLFIFGGVAEMHEEPPSPKAEFLMSLAGPVSSSVLGIILLAVAAGGHELLWPVTLLGVLEWIGQLNFILAAFNLVPGFPLDGGRVLRSVLWKFKGDFRWATENASKAGSAFGALLIGWGVFNIFVANPIGGLWFILIGLFLRSAAKMGYQRVLMKQAFEGEPVKNFMNSDPVTVSPSLDIESLVEEYIYKYHYKVFPVTENGTLKGCVNMRKVKEVPKEKWKEKKVSDIADNCDDANTIEPGEDAMKALSKMRENQNQRMMVVENGNLKGILTLKDLLDFLSLKLELDEGGPSVSTGKQLASLREKEGQ